MKMKKARLASGEGVSAEPSWEPKLSSGLSGTLEEKPSVLAAS